MAASDDEIEQLRDSVRDFLADALPSATVRAAAEGKGFDAAAWATLSASLGLTGIGIDKKPKLGPCVVIQKQPVLVSVTVATSVNKHQKELRNMPKAPRNESMAQ